MYLRTIPKPASGRELEPESCFYRRFSPNASSNHQFSKIVKHYDSLTFVEEAEADKILMGKISTSLMSLIGFPFLMRWPQAVMYQSRSPQLMIFVRICFEDARRSRARTISYRWTVIGTPETHHGDIKAVSFKEKIHGNSSNSGLSLFCASSVVRTITLTPVVVRELQSSRTIKTVLMSVRRPMVG